MSLVTTCPACGTRFRVRPEQLAAHRGDVRCGRCSHVFNALERLDQTLTPGPASLIDSTLPQDTPPAEAAEMPQARLTENATAIVIDAALPEFKESEQAPEDTPAIEPPAGDAGMEPLPENSTGQTPDLDVALERPPTPAEQPVAVPVKTGSTISPVTAAALHPASGRSGFSWLFALTGFLLILSAAAQLTYFM
ncbi:MAG: hypothetical protein FGM62_06775, partial [Methylobacterium sp.]|nr:hypothetical protein [Methylobacterium sp.]